MGDEQAFEEMYLEYYKRFYVYGVKLTGVPELVEDAIHDIMIYIWEHRTTISEMKNPPGYFFTSFRNLLFKKLKQVKLTVEDQSIHTDDETTPEKKMIEKETARNQKKQLERSFDELTPRQLEAVLLRFYHQMSYEEIAGIMNITTKATYKLMARALAVLKEKYVHLFVFLLVRAVCLRG